MTATDPALIIVLSCIILGIVLFAAALIRSYRDWDGEPTCSLDCRDKYRYGLTDPDCPVPHPTNHFAMTREQVGLINDLDGQIGFAK